MSIFLQEILQSRGENIPQRDTSLLDPFFQNPSEGANGHNKLFVPMVSYLLLDVLVASLKL